MSRVTPQPGWHDARESKPSQGDRVILKVTVWGDEDSPHHVIGYWNGIWEICQCCIKIGDIITPEFDQEDVVEWHIIPA